MKMLEGLKSKKLIIGVLGAIGIVVNDALGKPVSDEAIYSALALLGTYVLAQGVADHGAQGAAKATERAIAKGGKVAEAVQRVLGKTTETSINSDEGEDGPEWDPKELLE